MEEKLNITALDLYEEPSTLVKRYIKVGKKFTCLMEDWFFKNEIVCLYNKKIFKPKEIGIFFDKTCGKYYYWAEGNNK